MNQIACKCGKSSMNFLKLTQADMPEGWEAECCQASPSDKALKELVEQVEASEEVSEEVREEAKEEAVAEKKSSKKSKAKPVEA